MVSKRQLTIEPGLVQELLLVIKNDVWEGGRQHAVQSHGVHITWSVRHRNDKTKFLKKLFRK